jgi:ABC-type multidrug transport system ATPase subunit
MTAFEHCHFYSMFQLSEEAERSSSDPLVQARGLEEVLDKPPIELSGGDVWKVAVALSFLGRAKIILLDEPTAGLDAVGRCAVHELILSHKREKTFMLSEAEELCDTISIIMLPCVYTIGTPEYLSARFGTEYKVDVGLLDETEETSGKCSWRSSD